jgi:four helix bundle protein
VSYQSFEDLEVWKRGCRLATDIYESFRESRDFALPDQMTRAAVSIPSNIAEGHERGTNKEFVRFLRIAGGSAAELRTQLYIARKVGLIEQENAARMVEECRGIGAMLHALAKSRDTALGESSLDDSTPAPGTDRS